MLASACSSVSGQLGVASGVPADAGQTEIADDQGGFVVVLVGLAVAVAPIGAAVAVPGATLSADGLVRRGVAPALGGEMSAEAEHVGPAAESAVAGVPVGFFVFGAAAARDGAQLPGVGDEPSEVSVRVGVVLGGLGVHPSCHREPGGFG